MKLFHDHSGQFATLKSKLYHAYHWFFVRLLWSSAAVIAFTVHYYPVENVQPITLVEVVHAAEEKAVPILDRIAECESGNTHFDPKTGQVLTVGNSNKTVDLGRYQINEHYWGAKATELGLSLYDEEDNETMAKWILANYGTEPWVHSKGCWS